MKPFYLIVGALVVFAGVAVATVSFTSSSTEQCNPLDSTPPLYQCPGAGQPMSHPPTTITNTNPFTLAGVIIVVIGLVVIARGSVVA